MNKVKLVCFDVDGTLVDGISWLFLTEGLGSSTQEHINIFQQARDGKITFTEGERMLTKMYQDSGNATKSYIRKIFTKIELRPEGKEIIKYLKKKGYQIYLISGAIDIYVEEISKKLNVDGFYANSTLDFDNKGVLERIHYRDNQGEIKLEQLQKLIKNLGIKMDEVAFIGDSENDIEVFKKTGKGIAVHCFSEELKNLAWKTADSLTEIKRIL